MNRPLIRPCQCGRSGLLPAVPFVKLWTAGENLRPGVVPVSQDGEPHAGGAHGQDRKEHGIRTWFAGAAPLGAAIGVFGTIYGAAASGVASPVEIILSSVIIFSGAVQFAFVGLALSGASPLAILTAAAILNTRNLLLGAALRPKLQLSRPRRALLAWWLLDESAGLALASGDSAARVLLRSGLLCYSAWIIGTAVGVAGASLASLEDLAQAVFPVLFVGLAALSIDEREGALRAAAAALLTLAIVFALPQTRGLAPVIAAVLVAVPGIKR